MRKTPFGKYKQQRENSERRGISFELTFAQWWLIWYRSGKYHLRGRRLGQYCMARKGDRGPYAVGNVEIKKNEENRSEFVFTAEHRKKMSLAGKGRVCSYETRLKRSLSLMCNSNHGPRDPKTGRFV